MSTATAPVSRNAAALSATASIGCAAGEQRTPPATGRVRRRSQRAAARANPPTSRIARRRAEMTSLGSTTVPALKTGIEAAGQPEAHQRRGAGIDEAAGGGCGQLAAHAADGQQRAIAERRQTVPPPHRLCPRCAPPPRAPRRRPAAIQLLAFRGASGCGRRPAPTAGNRRNSRDTANRTPAESRAP